MVRSKQTCKKTTGGPAKRGALPHFKSVQGHAGTTTIKTVFSKPTPRLLSSAKVVLKPVSHNIYCFFCRDGGSLYDCSKCPRAVCHKCIIIPKEFWARVQEEDVHFICPGCHETRGQDREGDTVAPYSGFMNHDGTPTLTVPAIINGHAETTSRSQTLQPSHSPAAIMRQELMPYRPSDIIQYREVIFDFGTVEKFNKHTQAMKKLVRDIKHTAYERVEIVVYTHSETLRGDLWGGFEDSESVGRGKNKTIIPGEPVAYTVDQFFAGLFVGGMEDYAKGATLWMLACGHMVREPIAFNAFKDCVKRYGIEHVFAFGAELFHACLTTPLFITYVDRVLVEGFETQEVMQDLLLACPRLANHSSIVHLHITNSAFRRRRPTVAEYKQGMIHTPEDEASLTTTTYTFFHENNRPCGKALPYQCSNCMCIRTWQRLASRPATLVETKFTCKQCGHAIAYTMPKHSRIILFSQGYRGTSAASVKMVKKGHSAAGSGWFVSETVEGGAVTDADLPSPFSDKSRTIRVTRPT
ncbi:hypothetical protein DEU56DRAFT_920273 [Suillus clintonianus]|uniref:uncharacterized protein n=1 Tax=Suillus clintonianus TaxID=1904413 RepID=UPI001B86F6AE|nr:uncharacterized protein DEU56DRAFT_920273 [Suillus clintonianus]KAG2109811.1 hypothetical protein DEU56DRAFT_920273 [Suillus clintonianus]